VGAMTGKKVSCRRSWSLWLVLLAGAAWLGPQAVQAIEFEASVDRVEVGRSDPIRLTLSVRSESSLNHVPAPDISLSDFDVHGPNVSTRVEMVNFSTTYTRELTYTLFARRTGKITIGPARLSLSGQQYESNSIEIEVINGSMRKAPVERGGTEAGIEENLFVRIKQSHRRLYVGQQLTLDYDLCYRFRLYDVGFKEIPDFAGFWNRELFVAQQLQPKRENIGGVAFNVAPLRRMALFPTSAGSFTIEPLIVNCQIPRRSGRRRSLLEDWGGGSLQAALARSEAVEIEVRPLPTQGQPANFGGAVGRFALEATAAPPAVKLGDPVTYKIKITGQGNVETVQPPDLGALKGFGVYEPKVEDEEAIVGGQVSFTRIFEYILIPEEGGSLNIPAVGFAYFDPDAEEYKRLQTPDFAIEVKGTAEAAVVGAGMMRQQIQAVGRDIRYIKPDLDELGKPLVLHRSWVFWGAQAALPLAFVGLWGWRRHRRRLEGDVAYARRRRASGEAERRLRQAESLRGEGDTAAFYAEIQRAMLSFLADRFNLATAGLSAERVTALLEERGVDADTIESLRQLLARCDFARFAPGETAGADLGREHQTAADLIGRLEKTI
jgi:hypothetical protein